MGLIRQREVALLEAPGSTRRRDICTRAKAQTNLSLCSYVVVRASGRSSGGGTIGPSRMMKVAKTAFVLLGLTLSLGAYAQDLGGIEISAAEQQACGPDVVRLC